MEGWITEKGHWGRIHLLNLSSKKKLQSDDTFMENVDKNSDN